MYLDSVVAEPFTRSNSEPGSWSPESQNKSECWRYGQCTSFEKTAAGCDGSKRALTKILLTKDQRLIYAFEVHIY